MQSTSLINAIEGAFLWENKLCYETTYFSIDWFKIHTNKIYETIILTPLARLYIYGPSLSGWGFWGGLEINDICAQKTNTPADFWKSNHQECIRIVSKSFYGLVVLIESIFYFIIIWKTLLNIMLLCKLKSKK